MFEWIVDCKTTLCSRRIPDRLFEKLFIHHQNCCTAVQKKDSIEVIKKRQRLSPPSYEESNPKPNLDQSKKHSRFYWNQEREIYRLELSIPIQLQAAYFECHATPKWYMHPEFIKICIAGGGCCGRDCGCCEMREPIPGFSRGLGHCTIDCGCCTELRGFTMTEEEKLEVRKADNRALLDKKNGERYRRIKRAFMDGTVFGKNKGDV